MSQLGGIKMEVIQSGANLGGGDSWCGFERNAGCGSASNYSRWAYGPWYPDLPGPGYHTGTAYCIWKTIRRASPTRRS